MRLRSFFGKSVDSAYAELEDVAMLLGTNKEALKSFEDRYKKECLNSDDSFLGLFKKSADMDSDRIVSLTDEVSSLVDRIVDALLEQTKSYTCKQNTGAGHDYLMSDDFYAPTIRGTRAVTPNDLNGLKKADRPQLTDCAMCKDVNDTAAYPFLMHFYQEFLDERHTPAYRIRCYHMFRQGLDIQDLDPVTYLMLGTNPASMGYWLPKIDMAVNSQGFFKIPDTTIIKVPMSVLQMTRLGYETLKPLTKEIVNRFCYKAFGLRPDGDYFIKTGTFSSKFDFRNAHITGESEVKELGEYLLYLNSQAVEMAGPLSQPSLYGVSTTNEWVVRDFIKDSHNKPVIYKGLPLRTEYRLFVDMDENSVIGTSPYWEPELLKKRFSRQSSIHEKHDYLIIKAYKNEMMKEYHAHIDTIKEKLSEILPNIDMHGHWSIDIMQEGNDFYLIDMAPAESSALYDCVPEELRRPDIPYWELPKLEAE